MLSSFYLRDLEGDVVHKMHIIRDPSGHVEFSLKWNSADTISWTKEFMELVPMKINPTDQMTSKELGIFFIEHKQLSQCFDAVSIAHYRGDQGFQHSWYDVEDNDCKYCYRSFKFTIIQKTIRPIYLSIETYLKNIVPSSPRC